MKNLFLSSLLLSTLLTGTSALAGNEKGNGGDGLWLNGKLYSLDLVEAGVEDTPFFDSSINVDPFILDRVTSKLDRSIYPVNKLAAKLTEIYSVDKILATVILKSIEMYQWRQVSSALLDVQDEDSILAYPNANLVQLATRKLNTVSIDRSLWSKLEDTHKVALIIHEMMYALEKPTNEISEYNGKTLPYKSQSSPKARQITGYFFTQDLKTQGNEGLENLGFNYSGINGFVAEEKGQIRFKANPGAYLSYKVFQTGAEKHPTMDSSIEEIEKHATSVCNIAIKDGSSSIQFNSGSILFLLTFDDYQAKTEGKKYLSLSSQYMNQTETLNFVGLNNCIEVANDSIKNYFKSVKKDYK